MKRKFITLLSILLAVGVFFAGCSLMPGKTENGNENGNQTSQNTPEGTTVEDNNEVETKTTDEEKEIFTLVESTENTFTYQNADGTKTATLTVTLAEGSAEISVEGNTLTIQNVTEDTTIELSGVFYGNIVATVDDDFKLELALKGLTVYSYDACPIYVDGGDKITISAKKETENLVFDLREAVGEDDVSAAIYVTSDLDLQGKGSLYVTSTNNNGIHTKDDLKVKNLTLQVDCQDNALKGNDSLTIESGTITLIARSGDGIKTSNSDISSKGKQRGTVSILAGSILIYAAEDGIDAAYNVEIAENDELELQIFTERYSKYSETTSSESAQSTVTLVSTGTRNNSVTLAGGPGGQGGPGQGGPGGMGMNEGNSDKSDTSTKGIKADNEILIAGGTITISAYDDAIHANSDEELENGETALGNVTISGGTLLLSSNDDGVHADGVLTISGGSVSVTKSCEGLEGNTVVLSGGEISVVASDDGVNAKAESGEGILISGGNIYVYAGGDGLDANSQTQYDGIHFAGGQTVIISTGNANSSIDTERGYKYTAGQVVAIGLSGGMGSESTKCQNLSSIGSTKTLTLQKNGYLVVKDFATVKLPASLNALVIVLGKTSANISFATTTDQATDSNGVLWQN